jgi:hypothetical protein
MSAVLKAQSPAGPQTAVELVKHCREHRTGRPAGDIADPKVMRKVLELLLERHIRAVMDPYPPRAANAPVDLTRDVTACALATLIGYLQDG